MPDWLDFDPWPEIFPGTIELVAAADTIDLPLIAGASPGLFDDLTGWFGGIAESSVQPVLDFLAGKISDLIRNVWAGVEGGLNVLARLQYRGVFGAFGWTIPDPPRTAYAQYADNRFFTSGQLLALSFQVLFYLWVRIRDDGLNWVRDRVNDALGFAQWGYDNMSRFLIRVRDDGLNWTRDRVNDALGFAQWGYDNMSRFLIRVRDDGLNWVKDRLGDIAGVVRYGFGNLADFAIRVRDDGLNWTRDRVNDALGFAAHGFTNLADFILSVPTTGLAWLKGRVVDALGFAARGATDLASWVERKFSDLGTWIYGNVLQPVLDELRALPGQLVTGAQDAFGFVVDGLRDIFSWTLGPLVDFAQAKFAIPLRLLRGDFDTFDDYLEAVLDPPENVMTSPFAFLFTPLLILASFLFQTIPALRPYNERWAADVYERIGSQILTPNDTYEGCDRGLISDNTARRNLKRHGFSGDELKVMEELRFKIPSASDLMRMADKRVWSLQVPEKYGQYSELPDQVVDFMEQIGFKEEWTRNYWRAHWDLPSPQQVFEMFHRDVITEEDITQYLGLTDWLPFFRDKLLAISYNPFTRIDLRRMYKLGILSLADVERGYRDLGLSPQKAARMTQFVQRLGTTTDAEDLEELSALSIASIRQLYRRHVIDREEALDAIVESGASEFVANILLASDDVQLAINPTTDAGVPVRDLTLTTVLTAYRERVWDRDRTQNELELHGLLPNEADVMLELEDLKLARDLKDAQVKLVRERYIGYTIDAGTARAQLGRAGIHPDIQALHLAEWDVDRERGARKLTVAEIFKALDAGILDDDNAFSRLL